MVLTLRVKTTKDVVMALAQTPITLDDTIVAVASAPGAGLEGIIRLSGPAVASLLTQLAVVRSPHDSPLAQPAARIMRAEFQLRSEWRDEPVPVPVLIYLWPDERSYTRQPLAELYLSGSPALLDLAVRNLCDAGARLARPGEFTLRAFLAGRLDLTQAEAVLGVIEARDTQELQIALGQLAGGLAGRLGQLRSQLLELLAHLEAGLDFVEEDIDFISRADLLAELTAAAARARCIVAQLQARSEASSTAPRIVLLGEPNAGKSSLLNALTGSAAAIVSEIAGTTRDYLVQPLDLNGQTVLLIDTAGVEDAAVDEICAAAQSLGQTQHERAALQLLCIDGSAPLSLWSKTKLAAAESTPRIIVWTKCDLPLDPNPPALTEEHSICTSAATRLGLDELRQAIVAGLATRPGESDVIAATATRCHASLQAALAALDAALVLAAGQGGEEWIAAELRLALDEVGQVTGAVYTDDILDRVFSRFCIGK